MIGGNGRVFGNSFCGPCLADERGLFFGVLLRVISACCAIALAAIYGHNGVNPFFIDAYVPFFSQKFSTSLALRI